MKLIDLHIEGFGKLNDKYIDFSEGINVVTGHNEAGKSTLHACIRAMLYGMERAKGVAAFTDTYAHFKPWTGGAYGAVMRVEYEGKVYRIERDFLKDPIGCTVYDETEVREVEAPEEFMDKLRCGLSKDAYDNTISIGQLKSSADDSMARELKNYIVNMDTAGNRALNCAKAKQYLNEKKRELSEKLETEAAREYAANAGRIRKLEEEIKENRDSRKDYVVDPELEKAIEEGRESMRTRGVHSSKQVEDEETEYALAVNSYEETIAKNAVVINRILYIVSFVLAVIAVIAAAYLMGSNYSYTVVFGVLAGAVLFLILAVVFIIVCIISKNNLKKKKKALSELLERHCGFSDITPERIERVKVKLEEFKVLAASVEEKEARLVSLRREFEEKKAQRVFEEEEEAKISEINTIRERNEVLKEMMAKNEEINEELEAIDMALETIEELEEKMQDSLGIHLNAEAGKYIREITNGVYDSMSVDDEMNVYMNTEDKMVPVEQVSSGTSDQIYMALRVAGARLMQGGEDKLPLIFDDSFVNYDEDRLTAALTWLSKTFKNQIIIFSCHKREIVLLEENNIPYSTIVL